MKTKTGQFLMQQSKSKNQNQTTNLSPKNQQKRIVTPIKQKKSLFKSQSKEKNSNQQIPKSKQKPIINEQKYHQQISELRNQNRLLCEEIEKLKRQYIDLKSSYEQKCKNIPKDSLKQQKQNIDSTKATSPNKNKSQLTERKNQHQTNILQQKLRSLQVQNYRLIESNYVLLLRLKRNMKQYKDSLLKIGNMLENMEFNEASREIYGILGRMKNDQGRMEQEIGQIKINNKSPEKLSQKEKQEFHSKKVLIEKQNKLKKLKLYSETWHQSHFPSSNSLKEIQNSIQMNLRHISSPTYRNPSNSFQFISQQPPKSIQQFPSKKLFNSQIHDPELIERSPSAKEFTDWENGQINGSIVNKKVYKCQGNSMQLYKMLLLQASAIQSFFN